MLQYKMPGAGPGSMELEPAIRDLRKALPTDSMAKVCPGPLRLLKIWNSSRISVSSLRRDHANLLCIVPILIYVLP